MLCTFCGKDKKLIDSHHLIPRWCDGVDEDIVEVCRGCHSSLDAKFKNFIFYGDFTKPKPYSNNEKVKASKRRSYERHKDKINERIKIDRRSNSEKYRSKARERYKKNKDNILDKQAEWRLRVGKTKSSSRLEGDKDN